MKLRTENIHKSYRGKFVVNGVSVEVNQGEIVGLLGPNGAGKTTSFYMMVGLISPNSGHVFLDDQDITHYPMYRRAQLGVGYLPQEVSVFRKMTVEDNIMAVLEMTKLKKEERNARLEKLLDEFGLQHVRRNMGQSLSGGEKRRTEIARALATDPKFILLDEPFAGVDPIAVEDIQRIVWTLKSKNIGVLITDHNVQETLSITDRAYLLFEGSILRSGTAEELAADPQVRKVYLGQNFELRRTNFEVEQSRKEPQTELEKNIAYLNSLIHLARNTRRAIGSVTMSISAGGMVTNLVEKIAEFEQYFVTENIGKSARKVFNEIKFGPKSAYTMPFNFNGIEFIFYIAVPILGWIMIYISNTKVRKCKADLDVLVGRLESLKHLLENPEMENLL